MDTYQILGVKINDINYTELVDEVRLQLANKSDGLKLIFTPNPEIIYASLTDDTLRDVLNKADINLPDGIGIVIASKIIGHPITQRVTGVDAFLKICEHRLGRIFLLGSKPGVAARAADVLTSMFPGIGIAGFMDGYFRDEDNERVVAAINQSGANILFVGLGAPRQEMWLLANRDKLQVKLAMVMGGSLDVVSGDKDRAPELFIKLNIEWLYRLYQEPSRYKRMMVLPKFILKVLLN